MERRPDTDEKETLACLRHAEVCCVYDLWRHDVFAIEREIGADLISGAHLIYASDVLYQEGLGGCLPQNVNEPPLQSIARIVDHPRVVANLRECLAGWAANENGCAACSFKDLFANGRCPDVARDDTRLGKFSAYVAATSGSEPEPARIANPAWRKPSETPPAPANMSTQQICTGPPAPAVCCAVAFSLVSQAS